MFLVVGVFDVFKIQYSSSKMFYLFLSLLEQALSNICSESTLFSSGEKWHVAYSSAILRKTYTVIVRRNTDSGTGGI